MDGVDARRDRAGRVGGGGCVSGGEGCVEFVSCVTLSSPLSLSRSLALSLALSYVLSLLVASPSHLTAPTVRIMVTSSVVTEQSLIRACARARFLSRPRPLYPSPCILRGCLTTKSFAVNRREWASSKLYYYYLQATQYLHSESPANTSRRWPAPPRHPLAPACASNDLSGVATRLLRRRRRRRRGGGGGGGGGGVRLKDAQ